MTACGRIVVTAGPTISAADIRSVVPDAEVAPPIAFGQALSYDLRSGDTLLIVDGLFFQQPSVRHKELLTLMADGVRVVGSSSMGALRAAELHPFGMEGYGWVFESYRDGVLEADDEVGVVHGDADDGYPVFVDALVNMRHTLARAVATGVVCSELAERIIETARATPFTMRTWARLLVRSAPRTSAASPHSCGHCGSMSNTPMRCWRCGSSASAPGGAASSGSAAHRVVAAVAAAMGTAHLRRRIGRPRRVFCRRHRLGGLVVFERELG